MEYNSGSNRASNFKIFETTSTITLWIVRHEVQLLINRNYNKIREEYNSGINYLTWFTVSNNIQDWHDLPYQINLNNDDDEDANNDAC